MRPSEEFAVDNFKGKDPHPPDSAYCSDWYRQQRQIYHDGAVVQRSVLCQWHVRNPEWPVDFG